MSLSASRELDRYVDQELRAIPVAAGVHVYKGALVGLSGGFGRGLVAGDSFVGVAYEDVDNTAGSDGDVTIRVYTIGDFEHVLAGAASTDNGAAIYASDDATITTVSTSNSEVGRQVATAASGSIVLRIKSVFGG